MANKTIPQLPEQTGKTDNDLLAIVDSGETTTSKIKVSTLLAGVGGTPGVTGDTLNDNISSVNSIVATPNIFSGTTDYVNFGHGNKVWGGSVIYGYDNVPTRATVPDGEICVGWNNDYHANFGGTEAGNITIGNGNTKKNDGVVIGRNITGSRGVYVGYALTEGGGNDITGNVILGKSNTHNGNRGITIGGNITNNGDGSINLGWYNAGNNRSTTQTYGWYNTINSNGDLTNGMNTAIGIWNTITGGYGQNILSSDSDITSTGNYNTILGGFQNAITGTTSGTTIIGNTGFTATKDDMVYMPAATLVDYASYNFADDSATATGGVELGGIYHNAGQLRVRIT